jgi:hypothetical protein
MAYVHHHDVTDLITGQRVTPPKAPEGDRQVGPRLTVYGSGSEIDTRWAVDSYHRHG